MQALQLHAGPYAHQHLRDHGLQPHHIAAIPGAAGGPKGLILNPLDRFLFGHWLKHTAHSVHLLGASIGAWRMASACMPDADAALARMAHDYIHQHYDHAPGKSPTPRHVSEVFAATLAEHFAGHEDAILRQRRFRLHVFTSRGRHALLRRQGRVRTPLGYLGAFAANAVSRQAMGGWLDRVVFADAREPLPIHLDDYRTTQVALDARNLRPSILASCSIPFWLDAVTDIPGAPPGAYWDGGITDYHLHLDYASMLSGAATAAAAATAATAETAETTEVAATADSAAAAAAAAPLVLYPHFQKSVIPGWLDKGLRHRHRASERLSNVVLLSPNPEWVKTLPNGKLPDRNDFMAYGDDVAGRAKAWTQALAQSRQLADEFETLLAHRGKTSIEAIPLA